MFHGVLKMARGELEFHSVEGVEWRPAMKGVKTGKAWEKILSMDDETGGHTRLYRMEPGCETEAVLTHEFWEEVYVLQGGLIDRRKKEVYTAGMYACRPPGMKHGPYSAPVGFLGFEVRYYTEKPRKTRGRKT